MLVKIYFPAPKEEELSRFKQGWNAIKTEVAHGLSLPLRQYAEFRTGDNGTLYALINVAGEITDKGKYVRALDKAVKQRYNASFTITLPQQAITK